MGVSKRSAGSVPAGVAARPALLAVIALALASSLLAGACGTSGLNFVQDDRVSITTPGDREVVELPVTVRWEVEDFDGTFAVFVDRAPVPPGRPLEWLARDDDVCESQPGCPGLSWFNAREVYPTAETELTLTEVPDLGTDEGRVFHEATVVLIGRDGKRVGEAAFTVEFQVEGDSG